MPTDMLGTLGFAMGSAWLSGINLYATVVTLGLLQRFHLTHLPGDLDFVQNWWVIITAGCLYLVEFAADKIPVVDSIWIERRIVGALRSLFHPRDARANAA